LDCKTYVKAKLVDDFENIRVIRKVRKTQHQNLEFGETKKNLRKSTLAFKGG